MIRAIPFFGMAIISPNATPNMTGAYPLTAVHLQPNGTAYTSKRRLLPLLTLLLDGFKIAIQHLILMPVQASPDKSKYPVYMAPDGENYRAVTAIKILKDAKKPDT
jgi:hypothetical protein